MEMNGKFSFQVHGRRALFSDPVNRIGGEKTSYQFPTYQALKGICESVYWKPSIIWHVTRAKIMHPIQTETVGIRPIKYTGKGNELAYYTYLKDVLYEIEAEFSWNHNRPELSQDWNWQKHEAMFLRALHKGGRRDIFLGTRECQGYVQPCNFNSEQGFYDTIPEMSLGVQFHSFIYPDEMEEKTPDYRSLTANLWRPVLRYGILTFPRPQECEIQREIYKSTMKSFVPGTNFSYAEGGDV